MNQLSNHRGPMEHDTEPESLSSVEHTLGASTHLGRFGKSWWAERWIKALTQVIDPSRLARGRAYARNGHVLSLVVQVGLVRARVQGSRPTLYHVRVEMRTFDEAEWERVVDALASQASFMAYLLNGEMPHDVEDAFASVGLDLFPSTKDDMVTHCTCPDWPHRCKHVAAVYLLLGDYFDEDPFLLLTMRGRTKDMIMAALRRRRASAVLGSSLAGSSVLGEREPKSALSLEECLESFWHMGDDIRSLQLRVAPPEVEMELIKMLGAPTFLEDDGAMELLESIFRAVSKKALKVAYGH